MFSQISISTPKLLFDRINLTIIGEMECVSRSNTLVNNEDYRTGLLSKGTQIFILQICPNIFDEFQMHWEQSMRNRLIICVPRLFVQIARTGDFMAKTQNSLFEGEIGCFKSVNGVLKQHSVHSKFHARKIPMLNG